VRRHSIKVLGLALAGALGLMAMVAVIAQAENLGNGGVAGKFRVEGSTALAVNTTFAGQLEALTGKTTVHMVLWVPEQRLVILCVSADTEEGKILGEEEALVKVKFLGCEIKLLVEGKEEPSGCKFKENALTLTTKILPKVHENQKEGVAELYLLFEGDPAGAALGEGEYVGEGCGALPEAHITGSAVALIKEGSTEQLTKLFTFSETIQLLFQERNKENKFVAGDRLLFGGFDAYLEGNATLSLTGTHINKKWSVI
jgi:hypothetical protein